MDYNLDQITTVEDCDILIATATKEKENLERRLRNLGESIETFGERTASIGEEMASALSLLDTYNVVYPTLPDGKDKATIKLQIERTETRVALLEKSSLSYNSSVLLGRQFDYNALDKQIPEAENYVTALETRKAELEAAGA